MPTSTHAQAVDPQVSSGHSSRRYQAVRPTFGVACWLLAMLAFLQLITVGTALTVRSGSAVLSQDQVVQVVARESGGPIQPRSIDQILADAGHSPAYAASLSADLKSGVSGGHGTVRVQPSSSVPPAAASSVERNLSANYSMSMIANPRVERLVQESRNLHLEGDMMRAMLKLGEAGRIDPTECAVIYQQGILYEDMGIFIKASDEYQKIQQMGLLKAGRYFNLAADKLSGGMTTMSVRRDTIAIGPMKVNKGTGPEAGRSVNVAVTLLARPDKVINPDDVVVDVHFYDRVNGGEIKKAARNAQISSHWSDTRVDWTDVGNEETFRVSYTIPTADRAEEHLFGRREFYGYVVELLYKGEVIDQQAYPRRLHSIHSKTMVPFYQEDMTMPWLPTDDNSLLPGKNDEYFGGEALPSR